MNTEKLVVWEKSGNRFSNKNLNFEGTREEAEKFAIEHNFGGVEVILSLYNKAYARKVNNDHILNITR